MRPEHEITERFIEGERHALARMISWAEDGDPRFPAALAEVWGRVGASWRFGVTGPPGAGKSTLVDALAVGFRSAEQTVGVLAIDPSSPFSGGALLGDRIRMEDRTADSGVFIRSMASRGSHGGLARSAVDAADVMDAYGFDHILLETVGVGQAEYDIVSAADTVLVVLCPGAGDGIQAMKAGILEVADVLVVNKSDLAGADQLVLDLEEAVHTREIRREPDREGDDWVVPVVRTSCKTGEGLDVVLAAIARHREHLEGGDLQGLRAGKRVAQVRRVIAERLEEKLWGPDGFGERLECALRAGATPYDVAQGIVEQVLSGASGEPRA